MEKVKVTREQAEAIERWENKTQLLKAAVIGLFEHGKDEPIAEMDTETLAKAIYIGYEVEPEFKVGDWAVWRSLKGIDVIKQIEKVEGYRIWADWLDEGSLLFAPSDEIRHATPEEIETEKERRWWARHGREVWELKVGDVLKDVTDGYTDVVESLYEMHVEFSDGVQYTKDGIKKYCRIVCFAEDRKDI